MEQAFSFLEIRLCFRPIDVSACAALLLRATSSSFSAAGGGEGAASAVACRSGKPIRSLPLFHGSTLANPCSSRQAVASAAAARDLSPKHPVAAEQLVAWGRKTMILTGSARFRYHQASSPSSTPSPFEAKALAKSWHLPG